jgi:hypothetical protein
MIGHFPTPHPDELLYSVCARYSARVRYANDKSVVQELFGNVNACATVDLPNNLSHLSMNLPAGSSLTAERFITQRTLFPFFSAFLPPERVRQLTDDLQGTRGQVGYLRSGIMASRIPTPERLRLCAECAREDESTFGEPYWHRVHQVPGVLICPSHEALLEECEVNRHAGRENLQFIAANAVIGAVPSKHRCLSTHKRRVLSQIACDAAWLLEHPISGSEFAGLHSRYLRLLIQRGLASYMGNIYATALLAEFKSHYDPDMLQLLHCEFTGSDPAKTNWLLRLVRPSRHAQHPLYHLLLMQFLGCSAEEFFSLPSRVHPFGEGPWPCLNPAAEHYKEMVIQECVPSPKLRDNRPVGTFSCGCGFSYARSGPDSTPEDRFRGGRMIAFGPVWEARLKQLWKDSSLSLSEVGRRLGVDPLTVRRHALRLKLPTPRHGRKSRPLPRAAWLKDTYSSAAHARKRRACRDKWVSRMRQAPKTTLKALRLKLPREYAWLRRNDAGWLKRNTPQSRKRARPTSSVDWKKRDAEYAVAVKAAAARIKNNPGRPVQVTRGAIGRAVGAAMLLRQKLNKMPLTGQVIARVVETRVEYAARRIRWAAECFTRERTMPRPWQLMLRANVYSLRSVPKVKSAVDISLDLIESRLSFKQTRTA